MVQLKTINKRLLGGNPAMGHQSSKHFALFLFLFVYIKFIDNKVKNQLHKFTGLQKESAYKIEKKSSLARKRQ